MKKRIIRTIALIAVASVFVYAFSFSAFALNQTDPGNRGSGNGWVSTKIIKNNVEYNVTASASVNSDHSGYTGFSSDGSLYYFFGTVTYRYFSQANGIITSYSHDFPEGNGTYGHSDYAEIVQGYSYTSYRLVTGSVTLTAFNQSGPPNVVTLNPQLTGY